MSFLLIIIDVLIYNFTSYKTYFFLVSLLFFEKNDYVKVIVMGLILDLIVFNKLFINTIILLVIFLINKLVFKMKKKTFDSYLLLNVFNFVLYNLILIFFNNNFSFIVFWESLIINVIFYLVSYKNFKGYIKLVR